MFHIPPLAWEHSFFFRFIYKLILIPVIFSAVWVSLIHKKRTQSDTCYFHRIGTCDPTFEGQPHGILFPYSNALYLFFLSKDRKLLNQNTKELYNLLGRDHLLSGIKGTM